jgi:predicted ATP-grasp superfamily ATP-dependent carboligase
VGRRKSDLYQEFEIDGPAVELAIAAAEHFKLDGLVSVQTKETAAGVPHLLEINLRYSGGIAYTGLSGINLAGAFSCVKLNLPLPPINYTKGIRVKPVTTAIAC